MTIATARIAVLRVVRDIGPEAFAFENVAGLLSIDNSNIFNQFVDEVKRNHKNEEIYNISHFLLDTSEYGVPQFRSQLMLLGQSAQQFQRQRKHIQWTLDACKM